MRPYFLTICQIHFAPTQHRNLIVGPADFQRFPLRVYAVAFVDVVDTTSKPHSAVTVVILDCVDRFSCGVALNALGGNLPAGFVSNYFTSLKRQAVIVFQFQDASNVNHFFISLRSFPLAR